jgi:hypothetical protein
MKQNKPDVDCYRWVEGEAEAKGAQIGIFVIANPKQRPTQQKQHGEYWEGPGFVRRRIEGNHGNGDEIGRELLECVEDEPGVDIEGRLGLGDLPTYLD